MAVADALLHGRDPRPAVTADGIVITKEPDPKVLLIERGDEPFKGRMTWMIMVCSVTSMLMMMKLGTDMPSASHQNTVKHSTQILPLLSEKNKFFCPYFWINCVE